MKRQSGKGKSNLMILAGIGLGALLLLAKKGKAQGAAANSVSSDTDPADIPDNPKILAVNTSATENPVPTAVVSDEDGMEPIKPPAESSGPAGDGQTDSGTQANTVEQDYEKENQIPPFVSSKLTDKEKEIIEKGVLSPALAVKRPDLYKAAYIKKYGGITSAGKKRALQKATQAIDAAVQHAKASKGMSLPIARNYPAHPEYTFVQNGKQMLSQTGLNHMSQLQKKGVHVSAAALKSSAKLKLLKNSAAKKLRKASVPDPSRKTTVNSVTAQRKVTLPAKKKAVHKKR